MYWRGCFNDDEDDILCEFKIEMKDNGEIKGKGEAVLPNEDIRKAEVKGWRNDDRICLVWEVEEEDGDDEDYLRFGFAGLVGENDNELIGSYYP